MSTWEIVAVVIAVVVLVGLIHRLDAGSQINPRRRDKKVDKATEDAMNQPGSDDFFRG